MILLCVEIVRAGKSEETAIALQHIAGLERDAKIPFCEGESDRDKAIAQSQQITLEYQAETESIERAVEVIATFRATSAMLS